MYQNETDNKFQGRYLNIMFNQYMLSSSEATTFFVPMTHHPRTYALKFVRIPFFIYGIHL